MITYVNTVLVGKGNGNLASAYNTIANGQYIIADNDGTIITSATDAAKAEAIKIGMATGKDITYMSPAGSPTTTKEIRWSNIIKKADLKSYHFTASANETEDTVTFDFTPALAAAQDNQIRIVVRLTFKDMDTRYRKWSESYEVLADSNSDAASIANEFVKVINVKNAKRARVVASKDGSDNLKIVALPYSDDNTVDSISPANKVRFNGNAWYTVPAADGFESKNKYNAANIEKVPGTYPATAAKLVRDAEAQAMGYAGILNRGCCTWPIIKPDMNVDLSKKYEGITIEFENMYRSADDLQRRTKQTVQLFDWNTKLAAIKTVLEAFVSGTATVSADTIKKGTSDIKD